MESSEEIYNPDVPITLKESTSLFPNNLSVWGNNGAVHYTVTSKGVVNLVIGSYNLFKAVTFHR